ncbi:YceI family protein [bacterium]|jgi:polyisoprenoid-binding protein YceI|nr:YceI family protein [bacterium]
MKRIALSLLLAFGLAQADCTFSQPGNVDVIWKAYKTPLKLGVGGHFSKVDYKAASSEAANLSALLVGSTVSIDVASVDSKNKGRDEKLLNDFFKQMAPGIMAKIVTVKRDETAKQSGVLTAAVSMNGVTRDVPMTYSFSEDKLTANGVIDLSDFKAQNALKSINTACYDLHQGKTWSDVEVGFTMEIKSNCDQLVKK